MKELNSTLRHRRFMLFGSILYIICCLFACDNKATDPPRPAQENPIPVESEQKEADSPDDNAQDADTITAEELDAYREEIGKLSPDELIAKLRSDVAEIKAGAKNIARHLADNKQEEAKRITVDLEKIAKKNGVLFNVMYLRLLSGEFSQEQRSAMEDAATKMKEALKLAKEVNDTAIRIAEEK